MSRHSLTALLLTSLAFAGCTGIMEAPTPEEGRARVRALHLAADVPAVDVLVDGASAFGGLTFSDGTTYAEIEDGAHRLEVALAGETDPVLGADADLASAGSYTAVAYPAEDGPALLLLEDSTDETPDEGVRVRLVHGAGGVGPVDVYNMPRDGAPTRIVEGLTLGQAAPAQDLPSGNHIFGLDVDLDGATDFRFELPDLSAGVYLNLFAAIDESGAPILLAQLPGGITARVEATTQMATPGMAQVRVLHGSPDAPNVDVFVDDGAAPAFSDLPFTWGSSFAELAPGSYRFRVSATGTPADAAVIDVSDVALEADRAYTVVAFDRLADISPLLLEDDLSTMDGDVVRIRAAHTAVGVGEVDIYALGADGATNALFTDVPFGAASDPIEVPAGDYTIGFDVNDDGLLDAFFDAPPLVAGSVANLYALTDVAGDLFVLSQLRDGNTTRIDPSADPRDVGRIRVLHLSPDAPPVDVFLGGAAPIIEALPFSQSTELSAVPAAPYDVAVSATGASAAEAVLDVTGLEVAAGTDTTVVAYGPLSEIAALALPEDFSATAPGNIRIRVAHTASGVGEVDVLNLGTHGVPPILIDDLAFTEDSGFVELPAGAYRVGLDLNDDRVPEAAFSLPSLPAGAIANIFAVAEPTSVYLLAQLSDGTTVRIDTE